MSTTRTPSRIAPRRVALVFGLVALVGGLAIIVGGVSSTSGERALAKSGVVVDGTVIDKRIDHVTRRKRFGRTADDRLYVLHYAFATRKGEPVDGEQPVGEAAWRRVRVNGPVPVRYLETDPSVSRLESEPRAGGTSYPVTGGVLAAGGLAVLVVSLRKGKR